MLSLKLSPLLLLSTVSHSHEGGGGNGKASAAREVMTNLIHTYVNDYGPEIYRASVELFSPYNKSSKARFFLQQTDINGRMDIKGRVCNVCDDKGRCNTADDVVLQFYEYGDVRDKCSRMGGHFKISSVQKHAKLGTDGNSWRIHNGDIPAAFKMNEDRQIVFRGLTNIGLSGYNNVLGRGMALVLPSKEGGATEPPQTTKGRKGGKGEGKAGGKGQQQPGTTKLGTVGTTPLLQAEEKNVEAGSTVEPAVANEKILMCGTVAVADRQLEMPMFMPCDMQAKRGDGFGLGRDSWMEVRPKPDVGKKQGGVGEDDHGKEAGAKGSKNAGSKGKKGGEKGPGKVLGKAAGKGQSTIHPKAATPKGGGKGGKKESPKQAASTAPKGRRRR